ADLLLLVGLEHTEDTVDGLAGVDGMEGGEDEVAGFGGAEGDFDGFAVAHFADENGFGGLAEGGAEAGGETVEIGAEFALVKGGFVVRVDVLDGVFGGDDMDRLGMVDFVEDGGERGGLAGTGGAGDEDEAGFFLGDLANNLRELEPLERGDDR